MKTKKEKPEPQMVSIKISKILLDQFDTVIAKKGINRSEAIRAYMVDYVEENSPGIPER